MNSLLFVLLICSSLSVSLCRTKEEWKSRVIYQLLTDRFALGDGSTPSCDVNNYCGGNFQGIINNLDYIKNLGANAIWISPVVTNTDGGFHGYWAKDIYSINSNFGSADDLKNLVSACHAMDIWVMVDVVGNHMGYAGSSGTDYSGFNPFNQSEYFHDLCYIVQNDWDTHDMDHIMNCRLSNLPDLDQSNTFVHDTLVSWINDLVSTYGFDGIRIDTVPEVPQSFWTDFTNSAGVFSIGEVFDSSISYVAGYQGCVEATLNYPLYDTVLGVFAYSDTMNNIQTYYGSASAFPDQSVLGVFSDNHDNDRFLGRINDYTLFKSYLTFNLGAIGIPIIYYGSEQGFTGLSANNANREPLWNTFNQQHELYLFIQKVTAARASTQWYTYSQIQRYSDDNFYAFSRGTTFFAFTNSKTEQVKTITYHPYSDGQIICNIFWPTSDCITISNNQFTVYLDDGETKIYVLQSSSAASFLQA